MTFSRPTLLSLLAIFIPVLIFFSPAIFQGKLPIPADTIPGLYHPMRDALSDQYPNGPPFKNFLITDAVRQQYPWRKFAIDQLKQGEIPYWNPYNFSGAPLLANFQSAAFYPLNSIFWLTDFTTGWSLLVFSQQILGGLFLFLYLRNLKLSNLASLFGALVWAFSGHTIAWLEWNTAVHVVLWAPLILLSFDKIFDSSSRRSQLGWLFVLFASLTSQFYAGYPQPWLYLSLLQSSYFIWRFSQTKSLKVFIKTGLIYLLFFLCISPQLLATYQFSQLSNRQFDQGNVLDKPDWFLPYQNLVQLIVPDFFGNPATLNYWGVFNYTEFVSFIGLIPSIFILSLWLAKRKDRPVLFFTLFVFLSLLLATKNPVSLLQFRLNLPFLGSSQPSRWIVVLDLSLAVLAAIGLNNYLKAQKATLLKPLIIVGLIISSLWLVTLKPDLLPFSLQQPNLKISQRNLILPSIELAVTFFITLTIYLLSKSKIKAPTNLKSLAAFSLIVISLLSGLRFARKFTPFSNPEFLYPESKIISYLQDNAGLYRYMTTDRRLLAPNINLAYGLYTIEGYDPLYLNSYGRLISSADTPSLAITSKPFNRIVTTDDYHSAVINLLGVKYILSLSALSDPNLELITQEGQTYLYQNNQALPRAFVTQSDNIYDLTDTVPVEITTYQPNTVVLRTNNTQAGFLVLSDSYYPRWQATLDGQTVEILNYSGLRATMVPEGNHEIIYRYSQF